MNSKASFWPPLMLKVKIDAPPRLVVRRETVEALTGAPYDLQSIGLNLISLGGNVEETEDEFILHWNR